MTEEILTTEQRVALLSPKELRTLGLLALGWTDAEIGRTLSIGVDTVKSRQRSIRAKIAAHSRVAMALFYVDHVLPNDLQPHYTHPGQKLAEWRASAEQHRATLRQAKKLTPLNVAVVNVLLVPGNAEKSSEQLGKLITSVGSPRTLIGDTYKSRLSLLGRRLPGYGGRVRLAVIARLAPLSVADE